MKKLLLVFLILLPRVAWGHPLSERAQAIAEMAQVLEQHMSNGTEALTWGQQMALDDMRALSLVARQAREALEPDLELEQVRTQLSALQLAGSRVRLSSCVGRLDPDGVKLSQALVGQLKELEESLIQERSRLQDRQIAAARQIPAFSVGFGYPWWGNYNRGWGWGRFYGRRRR